MEIKDVTEVLWIKVSNISLPAESVPNPLILIKELMDLAEPHLAPKILSPSNLTKMFLESLDFNLPINKDPFLLPLMLHLGHLIPEVSLTTVDNPSITEFYSLVIPQAIG